jgi:hypothetical protein
MKRGSENVSTAQGRKNKIARQMREARAGDSATRDIAAKIGIQRTKMEKEPTQAAKDAIERAKIATERIDSEVEVSGAGITVDKKEKSKFSHVYATFLKGKTFLPLLFVAGFVLFFILF